MNGVDRVMLVCLGWSHVQMHDTKKTNDTQHPAMDVSKMDSFSKNDQYMSFIATCWQHVRDIGNYGPICYLFTGVSVYVREKN